MLCFMAAVILGLYSIAKEANLRANYSEKEPSYKQWIAIAHCVVTSAKFYGKFSRGDVK